MRKWLSVSFASLFVLSLGFAVKTILLDKPATPLPRLLLRFEIKSETPGEAMILFNNRQGGRFRIPYTKTFQELALMIPETKAPVWGIKMEPLQHPGSITFRNLMIVDESGSVLQHLDPAQHIESLNKNTTISITNGELLISAKTAADRPSPVFKDIFPLRTAVDNLPRVTPTGLGFAWLLLSLIAASLLFRMVWIASNNRSKTALWLTGVFVTVFGARLLCLKFMAVSFTLWDPWDHEAWNLYLPYLDGGLSWKVLFSPCNEHRIFFSRIFSLGQFLLNGQWDNRFECLCNSTLYASMACGLWMMLHRILRGHLLSTTLLVLAATALPFSWENIIWGLQSQFYFFLGFSLLTLWFLITSREFSPQWWLGAFFALCALFTTGSGIVPTATVAGVMIVRIFQGGRREAKHALVTLGICLVVGSLYMHVAIHEHNYGMITKTVTQGFLVFGRVMSWPVSGIPWICIFLWLPVSTQAVRHVLSKTPIRQGKWFLFGLAGWCCINAIGMAVYRGGFGTGIISRYSDMSAMFFVVNGASALLLLKETTGSPPVARAMRKASVVWVLFIAIGLLSTTMEDLGVRGIYRLAYQEQCKNNIIQFLHDDDLSRLAASPQRDLAYPDPMFLAACLRNETLRSFLPASIRPPIVLTPKPHSNFDKNPREFNIHGNDINPYKRTWSSKQQSRSRTFTVFESTQLPPLQFPYLEFELKDAAAGYNIFKKYDHDTFCLQLKNPLTKQIRNACSVRAMRGSRWGRWHYATFRSLDKTQVVFAVDNDLFRTLYFDSPREKSGASVWGDELIHRSPYILGVGLSGIVALFAQNIRKKKRT